MKSLYGPVRYGKGCHHHDWMRYAQNTMPMNLQDRAILEYALGHMERRKMEVENLIDQIHRQMGTKSVKLATAAAPGESGTKQLRRKRVMSAEGKAKLVAALKKRWAAYHKAQKKAVKSA